MRVVPLTSTLSLVDPTGEEHRWDLFLAFKAASIVLSKIQTDIQKFLQVLEGPSMDWPPVITTATCRFPSVTEIDAFPNFQSKRIKFALESRCGNMEHRHLYNARLVSDNTEIYVKFSEGYSVDLHAFCASQQLAPGIIGFQQLSGGWSMVAMEKIDTVNHEDIASFSEAGRWKKDIKALVDSFHQQDLVHGDLRFANFIFTKSDKPRRMLLVDFDWGGKVGEAVFPQAELIDELGVSSDRLRDRKITKGHDRRCLSKVLEWLDRRIPAGPVGEAGSAEMGGDSMSM